MLWREQLGGAQATAAVKLVRSPLFFPMRPLSGLAVARRPDTAEASFIHCCPLPPAPGQLRAHDGTSDPGYAEEAGVRSMWPLLLVFEHADCTLAEALLARADDSIATRDWRVRAPRLAGACRKLDSSRRCRLSTPSRLCPLSPPQMTRLLVRQLGEALRACHSAGFIHGGFSLRHCVRCGDSYGGRWKVRRRLSCSRRGALQVLEFKRCRGIRFLTQSPLPTDPPAPSPPLPLHQLVDFTGACSLSRGEFVTDRVASAFVPPETVYLDEDGRTQLKVVAEKGVLEARAHGRARGLCHVLTGGFAARP